MKITEYRAEAYENETKKASELNIGDFIYAVYALGKESDFKDFISTMKEYECAGNVLLCRIVDIVDVPEDFDFLTGWLDRPAPAHRGGAESDDVADNKYLWELTAEDYKTFYSLVTVFRKPSGKWLAVNCEGCDYWRYVLFPKNWRSMYAIECLTGR